MNINTVLKRTSVAFSKFYSLSVYDAVKVVCQYWIYRTTLSDCKSLFQLRRNYQQACSF